MALTLDTTTQAEYSAAATAQLRAEAVRLAMQGSITVGVYDGGDNLMGSGTMPAPFATRDSKTLTVGEVTSFSVTSSGTPDSDWYIKWTAANGRFVRGSFGVAGSGQDFTWSNPTWELGQTGTLGTITMIAAGPEAPVFIDAPPSANLPPSGGTIQFSAIDPNGDTVTYSLPTKRTGITINSTTGLVTVTSAAAGTSGKIVVQASDGKLTTDAECLVSVGTRYKWNPGHYVRAPVEDSVSSSIAGEIGVMPNVQGMLIRYRWTTLEPTRGNYNFSVINADLARLRPYGKRLVIFVQDQSNSGVPGDVLPAYLATEPGGEGGWIVKSSGGVRSRFWVPAIMDRIIALNTALADAYDLEPLIEGIRFQESTSGIALGTENYTLTSGVTQWNRLATAARKSWPCTNVFLMVNYLDGSKGPLQITAHCLTVGVGVGGPDLVPPGATDYQIAGDRVYMKNPDPSKNDNPSQFTTDYRTQIPNMLTVSAPVLGGKEGTFYPPTLASYGCSSIQSTHIDWLYSTSTSVTWSAHMKPYLNGSPLSTYQTFPTALTALGKVPVTGGI